MQCILQLSTGKYNIVLLKRILLVYNTSVKLKFTPRAQVVGRHSEKFSKNCALCDKSIKFGICVKKVII